MSEENSNFENILEGLDELEREASEESNPEGADIFVEIEDDAMSATVSVMAEGEGAVVSAMDIVEAVKAKGIAYGILHEKIEEISLKKLWFEKYVIAKGLAPKRGENGSIEFEVELKEADPKEMEGQQKGQPKGTPVKEGQTLAVVAPPGAGEPGKNIKGKDIPSEAGRPASFELGQNVKLAEDGRAILAAVAGRAAVFNGKIYIAESEADFWKIEAQISSDKMEAELVITPGELDPPDMSAATLMQFLASQGVKYGLNPDFAEKIPKKISKEVRLRVAKGDPAKNGVDGGLEPLYAKAAGDARKKFKEDDQGKVDFREVVRADLVQPGQELYRKTPPVVGKDGRNVLGETIPHKAGKDVKLAAGANVELSEDGLTAIAKAEGRVCLTDGVVDIVNVFEVKEDVDFSVGNINFDGCVVIGGNVLHGFSVKASRNIDVKGNVERGTLISGGDILVGGGVYGDEQSAIKAKGDVYIRSAEGARIECDGSLTVKQFLRNCQAQVKEKVKIEDEKKGHILGGRTTAGREIEAANLGSSSYPQTLVEIGIVPKLRAALNGLEKENVAFKKQIEKIEPNLRTLKKIKDTGALTPEKKELFDKLVKAVLGIRKSMDLNYRKIEYLKRQLEFDRHGHVFIKQALYPGVTIASRNSKYQVDKEHGACTITENEGEITLE